jgi:hypothetical protein
MYRKLEVRNKLEQQKFTGNKKEMEDKEIELYMELKEKDKLTAYDNFCKFYDP